MPHRYTFPAIRGIQAGREYYVSMCPLRQIPRLFHSEEQALPPELRAQRVLNKARVPVIANYILQNPREYVFSAITASIDADVVFEPVSDADSHFNVGFLHIPMSAQFVINDGQHRRAAIEQALKENPDLGSESIAVVFFVDTGLQRSQQLFADLNRYAIRPTRSLNVLYDYRDPSSQVARTVSQEVEIFRGLIETEKSTISNRSVKMFTLSGLHKATRELLSGFEDLGREEHIELATEYWSELSKHMPQWQLVRQGKLAPADFRKDYICAHTVALVALGRAGRELLTTYPESWKQRLSYVRTIDWHRQNSGQWEGRASVGGKIVNSHHTINLITVLIKRSLDLPLTPDEEAAESRTNR